MSASPADLGDRIFLDPEAWRAGVETWRTADAYLSGPVRRKLEMAVEAAFEDPRFERNIEALKEALPEDLKPSEITARLGAPWNPADTEITWAKTFGPNGNMQRFASSLIVVSGMNISASSETILSGSDRTTIEQNKSHGFWPFYKKNSSSVITTETHFDNDNKLTIIQTSPPNVPILIGRTVLTAAQYVGFEAPARRQLLQLLSRSMERIAA